MQSKPDPMYLVFLKRYKWQLFCLVFTAVKLWLVSTQTLFVISHSKFDDGHFLSQAESLLQGNWLGDSSPYTLMKGVGYPLWLAFNNFSGMPLLISQAFLYAVACWVLVCALSPVITSSMARSAIYLVVLYNPVSWDSNVATRLIRENIYPSLTLLLISTAMGGVLRISKGPKASVPWATAAGMVGALFAMTREEGIWVVPSLILIMCWGAMAARKADIRTWITAAACAAFAYSAPTAAVAYENWSHYGVFATCEISTKYFKSAYGSLTRVKADKWNPFVPVPHEARQKIYKVSPAYRQIGQMLEASVIPWAANGRVSTGVEDDIAGGWFIWAFRDAVAAGGKYNVDLRDARSWYRQIAEEIDVACREGKLDCVPSRSSLAPPWHNEYSIPFGHSLLRSGQFLTTFQGVSPQSTAANVETLDIVHFEGVTGEHIPRHLYQMTGVVTSRIGDVNSVIAADNRLVEGGIKFEPLAPKSADKGLRCWRYAVETPNKAHADFMFQGANGEQMIVPIAANSKNVTSANLSWRQESYDVTPESGEKQIPMAGFRLGTLVFLTAVYSIVIPPLAILALIVLLARIALDLRARDIRAVPLFALALLGAVLARLLMLSFIDVSSFPAINTLYMSPAYPLYLAAVTVTLFCQNKTMGLGKFKQFFKPGELT